MVGESIDRSRDITALYCANKQKIVETGCNQECQAERCLCMDEEQLVLLLGLMEPEIMLCIGADGGLQGSENISSDFYCSEETGAGRRLINCHQHMLEEGTYHQSERNVVGCLPIVQYVNMMDKIDSRRTLACLCLFHVQGDEILKAYMKAVARKLCYTWPDTGSIIEVGKAVDAFFCQLDELYRSKNYESTVKRISQNIEQFSNAYCKKPMYSLVGAVRDADRYLQEDVSHYKESSGPFSYLIFRYPDKRDSLYYLYRIINKILMAAGFGGAENMDRFFLKDIPENPMHDVYREIYNCVNSLLKAEDREKCQEICRQIEEQFAGDF